mgnify:CR=1 FL=1
MIRTLSTALFVLVTMVCAAQQYSFKVKPTGYTTGSSATDIVELANGNSLTMIRNGGDYAAVEIAPSGEVVQTMDFGGNSNNYMGGLAPMANGWFLQYGYTGYTKRGGFVMRDSAGTVKKDTFLRESSWSGALLYINEAVVDNNNNTYFVGHVYDIYSGGVSFYSWRIPVVGKLNSEQAMVWVKTFSSHTSSNKRKGNANSITFDADSNLLVLGAHSFSNSSSTARDYLAKFNPNGTTIWSRQRSSGSGSGTGSPYKVCTDSDGNIYTAKSVSGGVTIEKFRSGGTFVWSRKVDHATNSLSTTDMSVSADGDIYLCGTLNTSLATGVVMHLDSSGAMQTASSIELSASYGSYMTTIEVVNDNYVMYSASVNGAVHVFRADSTGFSSCEADTLSLNVDTLGSSWTSGVNLSGKSLTNYQMSFNNNSSISTNVDTSCYIAPPCDVVPSMSVSDTSLCPDEWVTLSNTSSGTGVNSVWFIDTALASNNNSFDTLLPSGSYDITLYIDGAYCDDTLTQTLVVNDVYEDSAIVELCVGDSFQTNGTFIYSDSIVVDTLSTTFGCDSVVTSFVSFLQSYTVLYDTICSNETLSFGGSMLTASGMYLDTVAGYLSCDSILELNLEVLSTSSFSFSDTICQGQSYSFGGSTFSMSGQYFDTLSNSIGCDSVVDVTLVVLATGASSMSQSICAGESFLFGGNSYSTAGQYYDTLVANNGCDSIVTLNLSVLPVPTYQYSESVCDGDSVLFGGAYVYASGNYVDTLTAANGCDSIVTLTLEVLNHSTTPLSATICEGDTMFFNGQQLTTAGVYDYITGSANGCDSIVTLTLSVQESVSGSSVEVICQGGSYLFNGQQLTQEGQYTGVFTSSAGCDSTHTLTIQFSDIEAKVGIYLDTLKSIFEAEVYEWIRCSDNSLTGIYSSYFVPGDQELYALVAYDENGCSDTSACFKAAPTGIANEHTSNIHFFPNPVKQSGVLFVNGLANGTRVSWFDTSGRLILSDVVRNEQINAPAVRGVYFVQAVSGIDTGYLRVFVE